MNSVLIDLHDEMSASAKEVLTCRDRTGNSKIIAHEAALAVSDLRHLFGYRVFSHHRAPRLALENSTLRSPNL